MKHRELKKMLLIAVIALIAASIIFSKKERQSLEIDQVSNKMNVKASLIQVNSRDVIYIKCKFKNAGVLHNPLDKHGISAVAAHMLFRRINGLSEEETAEKICDLGIHNFSTLTDGDDFEISFFVIDTKANEALKFLASAFSCKDFSSSYLEHVKQIYPYVLDVDTSDPFQLLHDKMFSMLYKDSTYGMSDSGSSLAVSSITTADIVDFVKNMLRRDNLEVVFAGKVSRFDINDYLKILLDGISSEERESEPFKLSEDMSDEKTAVITRSNMKDVACVMTGVRLDGLTDLERAAVEIIFKALFDTQIGDFSKGLREKGITYDVSRYSVRRTLSDVFYITACLNKDDLQNYTKYLDEKFADYFRKVNQKELERIKNYFIKISHDGFESLQDLDEKIKDASLPFDEVTPEICEKAARKLFDHAHIRTVIIRDASAQIASPPD
ncbi:hypothetical protein FACS189472_04710 [Alphaproteobacteria bacterium]|nr:hypothetical protein FACS189472_04710 [Alphaproteobacteria bacterium]